MSDECKENDRADGFSVFVGIVSGIIYLLRQRTLLQTVQSEKLLHWDHRILIIMNELAFEKIIRVRSDDLAVLDESAYYETVYAGNSVPNRKFYAIESPFRMNSQGSLIFEKDSIANKNKLKRKRKYGICSNITCDLRDASILLKKVLKKAVAMDAFIKKEYEPISCSSLEASLDFNNCLARQSVLSASSVPCPLSRYAGQQSTAKQDIKEICLNEENRIIDDIPNELVMWVNAESKVMTAECKDGKRFDFILLDPPWENKSVKRKTVYTTYEDQSWMVDLYVPELLEESGLFATWVTNNAKHFKFIDDMIEYFGFEKIATWRWLKVTNNGEPVCSLNSQHKQPFESIVFASSSTSRKYYMKIADEFVLISTPSAIHSRKPPLFPVLQALGILEKSATQLELYGRYLLSRTTTVGFEAAKLQNKRYFV
ncbi:DNA N6-methyl methyltransferase [Dirofilaria immitis]